MRPLKKTNDITTDDSEDDDDKQEEKPALRLSSRITIKIVILQRIHKEDIITYSNG